jgi:menaquinone-dependent protoporphyrinogen IX oxidase
VLTNTLIVYRTHYGATEMASQEIANVFRKEGLHAKVVNLKEEKIENIDEYDLILVCSGIQIGKWTKEPEKFLKKYQRDLVKKTRLNLRS